VAQLSSDGADLWLLGMGGEPAVGGPNSSARRSNSIVENYSPYSGGFSPRSTQARSTWLPELRKPTDAPVYWLLRGDQWVPQAGQGRRTNSRLGDSWAAIGGQLMIVAGEDGLGLLDDGWTPVALPTPVDWVYRLYGGGVIAGLRGEPAPAYFGVREGRHLTWIPFALTQAPG
jgi:hypothetical protein